jgi:hypothetical protein
MHVSSGKCTQPFLEQAGFKMYRVWGMYRGRNPTYSSEIKFVARTLRPCVSLLQTTPFELLRSQTNTFIDRVAFFGLRPLLILPETTSEDKSIRLVNFCFEDKNQK